VTANPAQGVRINRNGSLRRTAAGRIALPLAVGKDGEAIGTGDLVLTNASAEALHAELGRLLAESVPPATPERSE
jgi:hypothetical protein